MSYTVVVNRVPVQCDTPDEALDLIMCVGMRSDPPADDGDVPPPGQPAGEQLPPGQTTRHYACTNPACGRRRAITAARHAKVVMCDQPGCQGECAPSAPPSAP